jgi:hypothetical protein
VEILRLDARDRHLARRHPDAQALTAIKPRDEAPGAPRISQPTAITRAPRRRRRINDGVRLAGSAPSSPMHSQKMKSPDAFMAIFRPRLAVIVDAAQPGALPCRSRPNSAWCAGNPDHPGESSLKAPLNELYRRPAPETPLVPNQRTEPTISRVALSGQSGSTRVWPLPKHNGDMSYDDGH